MAGLGEHGAEEAADGAGADDRDTMQGVSHRSILNSRHAGRNASFTRFQPIPRARDSASAL